MNKKEIRLKRVLTLPLVTFYGLGNILGAGIYVLTGKVAGEAGYLAPLSFLVASVIAALSAVSYAEMSARYPVSAGEAVYIYEGLGVKKIAIVVGLMITASGIISSAVIAHGFAAYLQVFIDVPAWIVIVIMYGVLGGLAIWGISESVGAAAILTVVEIIGLLLIVFVGLDKFDGVNQIVSEVKAIEFTGTHGFWGVVAGGFLAFYAYIGFEDMVNVAEEVKQPELNMPRAIFLCVIISSVLYASVAMVSVLVISPDKLALSDAPLAMVYEEATGKAPVIISLIGLMAVVNGSLIQLIMSSRLLYGMAEKGWLPSWLKKVSGGTRTPVNSTLVSVMSMLILALMFNLTELAEMTSYLVLLVFSLVNLALIRLKLSDKKHKKVEDYSIWLPTLALLSCVLFLFFKLLEVMI